MNKEELIGKLHMIYAGDRNALEEMVGYYDGLKQGIEIVQQENKELKEQLLATKTNEETGEYALLHTFDKCNVKELLDILNEVSKWK